MTEHDAGQFEWLTRKRLIDPKLKGWGWTVVPFDLTASEGRGGCCPSRSTRRQTARLTTLWLPMARPSGSWKQAIADRKRLMLLAMATGTGKNFTMVNQVYRLMKSGVGRRILFLVDRRALAAQAVRAFAAVVAGQTFTPDQQRWLDRIREHRIGNLTIEPEDFDTMPIFARDGGWARANREFQGQLKKLLQRVNAAIAA